MTSIYDFSLATPDGGRLDLADLRGDVVLIVNVASKMRAHQAVRGP